MGGRLIKLDREGTVTYVSPVLKRGAMWASPPTVGQKAAPEGLEPVIRSMVEALEQAAGLRPGRDRLDAFLTQGTRWEPRAVPVVSFSGGVADCIYAPPGDWKAYGDIGVLLGRAIAASPAFQGAGRFRGEETIRATVVGAGSHSTELSGSTIYYRDIAFPLKNLPILKLTGEEERGDAAALAQCIRDKLGWFADEGGLSPLALALRGEGNPSYARVDELARGIAGGWNPCSPRGSPPWCWWRPTRPRCWVRPWPRGGGPSPLPGQRGGGQRRLYRYRRARGGRRGITGCHQDAGIQQIVTAKERSHDTQNKAAGARVRV